MGDMFSSFTFKIAIFVAAALLVAWLFRAYARRDKDKTRHMLDPFLSALEGAQTGCSPWGYECAEGLLDGRAARASLIPDSLITRTLPTLYLEVRWAVPHDGWLCVIANANGMEYFSDDVDAGARLVTPAEWPESAVARGKGPQSTALARRLRDFDFSAYPELKMATLSETETKVIMRCARGEIPIYRVMRSAEFAEDSVKPELVQQTIRVLRDLRRTLHTDEEVA